MTKREQEIFDIIRKQPTIDQNEIASILQISRSSVAVHISNLQKKGYIQGKGYLINESAYAVGIGAANVDIHCHSHQQILLHDSNPSRMHISLGGVTRNICENFSRLGGNVKLITAVGTDVYGSKIKNECTLAGIDMNYCMTVEGHASSTYVSCLDIDGDMFVAFSDMSVLQKLTLPFLQSREGVIQGAKVLICDPALPEEVLECITQKYGERIPVFVDPVSTAYAKRLKPYIGKVHTVKPNRMELGVLSGHSTQTQKDIETACDILLQKGVQRVVVSLGKDGCFAMDQDGLRLKKSLGAVQEVANATGGGDAFMGALVYSFLHDLPAEETLFYALAAGIAAVSSEDTINPNMSIELIQSIIKERVK